MTKEAADRMMAQRGYTMVEDAGRGWRRVVASPKPVAVIEIEYHPGAGGQPAPWSSPCGGGGIPVVRRRTTI